MKRFLKVLLTVETLDEGFSDTDHNPVVMQVELK